jgi:hypothetical protein
MTQLASGTPNAGAWASLTSAQPSGPVAWSDVVPECGDVGRGAPASVVPTHREVAGPGTSFFSPPNFWCVPRAGVEVRRTQETYTCSFNLAIAMWFLKQASCYLIILF